MGNDKDAFNHPFPNIFSPFQLWFFILSEALFSIKTTATSVVWEGEPCGKGHKLDMQTWPCLVE